MNPQTGSTHLIFRKPFAEKEVMEESSHYLKSTEQGPEQILLHSWDPPGVRITGSYRLKLKLRSV